MSQNEPSAMFKDFSPLLSKLTNSDSSMRDLNPSGIWLNTVSGCTYSCIMCFQQNTKVEKIRTAMLKKIEPYFRDLEVLAIHGDGEPLLGDIPYFVDQSLRHDFVLHMNTTAFHLSKKLADLLLRTRLSIRFSINSGTPHSYKRIMGGDFDRVIANIKYLVQQSKETATSHDFWFSFIYMKANMNEVEAFLKRAHDCGIRKVRFMRLFPNSAILKGRSRPGESFHFWYPDQMNKQVIGRFREELPRYQALASELGITIESSSMISDTRGLSTSGEFINLITNKFFNKRAFPLIPRNGFCVVPWIGQLVISQTGHVGLCCRTTNSLGNLNITSLEDIWNSDKMNAIRQSFASSRIPRACGYCRGIDLSDYPNNSFSNSMLRSLNS